MFLYDNLGVNEQGNLTIGGADVPALAREFKTPLYIMDEGMIRETCRRWTRTLSGLYGENFLVAYASKAFSAKYIYKIMHEEGFGTDVVSGGELYTAMSAGFPANKIYFHGNNKTMSEIEYALDCEVRCFVVDNAEELALLNELSIKRGRVTDISFRIKPGIDAHTHEFIRTGSIDSKFGVALENGEAYEIIKKATTLPGVSVVGVHSHIGSQIFEMEPYELLIRTMLGFMKRLKDELGISIKELNLGGGYGIKYHSEETPFEVEDAIRVCVETVKTTAAELGMELPFLVFEPGRSIVGPSGITVYTVGSVKKIPDVRTYVAVDGGMADNPRYALYGASYDIILPERPEANPENIVTIAGRSCESGCLITRDVNIPSVAAGDLLAVLSTGAYNYSMASHYNRIPNPPVVMVADGKARLIVRREDYEDLVRNDI